METAQCISDQALGVHYLIRFTGRCLNDLNFALCTAAFLRAKSR